MLVKGLEKHYCRIRILGSGGGYTGGWLNQVGKVDQALVALSLRAARGGYPPMSGSLHIHCVATAASRNQGSSLIRVLRIRALLVPSPNTKPPQAPNTTSPQYNTNM